MPWACRRAGLSGQVSLGHVVPGPCPAGGLCCWLVGLGCVFACLLFSYWLKTPPPCSARLFLPDTKERRKNDWERAKDPRPRWLPAPDMLLPSLNMAARPAGRGDEAEGGHVAFGQRAVPSLRGGGGGRWFLPGAVRGRLERGCRDPGGRPRSGTSAAG